VKVEKEVKKREKERFKITIDDTQVGLTIFIVSQYHFIQVSFFAETSHPWQVVRFY